MFELGDKVQLANNSNQLQVGMGSSINNLAQNVPFVGVQGTYSFGAPARNRHLDAAGKAFAEWIATSTIGPINLATQLRNSWTLKA